MDWEGDVCCKGEDDAQFEDLVASSCHRPWLNYALTWHQKRRSQRREEQKESLRTFDTRLKDKVNALSQSIHGKAAFPLYNPPSQYTGELFGVEYLYDQAGFQLYTTEENLDKDIDEGFEDVEDEDAPIGSIPPFLDDPESVSIAPPEESDNEEEEEVLKNFN